MLFSSSTLLSFALLLCSWEVKGQTTQTVQVGLEGSFFDPSYVVAEVGDIISFVFSGNVHTVTQSTFENPCLPLNGGFNSGPAGKKGNGTAPVPVWNLQITNASAPIWYFCQATMPSSHCGAGMVGVINPPNTTIIADFVSAARAVSGTPTPTFAVTLSGIGAVATASPSAVSTIPPTPSSASSSSSSAPATTTSTIPVTRSSTSNVGAIVGGAVGGVLGLLLILVALFWVFQQRRSRRRSIPPSDEFRYPKQPSGDFHSVRNTDPDFLHTPGRPEMVQAISRADTLTPLRRGSPHQPQSQPHTFAAPTPTRPQFALAHQQSFESETARSAALSQTQTLAGSDPASNINVQSLAREVANVLLQNPALAGQRPYTDSRSNSNVDGDSSGSRGLGGRRNEFRVENRDDHDGDMQVPPPHYRATVSSHGDRPLPLPREKWEASPTA